MTESSEDDTDTSWSDQSDSRKISVSINFEVRWGLPFSTFSNSSAFFTKVILRDNFKKIVDAYFRRESDKWANHHVCLVVRSYSGDSSILGQLITSGDLFWSKHIGRKVLVMDPGDEYYAASLATSDWDFVIERFPDVIGTNGFIGKQWSNMISYNYCPDEDYVAIGDTDSPLSTLVTYDLLFNASGYPLMMGSWDFQKGHWSSMRDILDIGKLGNGMLHLPFVMKKSHLVECQRYIEAKHKMPLADVLCKWDTFSQMCVLFMWAYTFKRSEYDFRIVEEECSPVMQYGVHLPYVHAVNWTVERGSRFNEVAARLTFNGVCSVFRPGTFSVCPDGVDMPYYWEYAGVHFKTDSPNTRNRILLEHFTPLWNAFSR